MKDNKLFVIGFHKTGTTSLGKALEILGYQVCGNFVVRNAEMEAMKDAVYQRAYSLIDQYDAFQDTPWYLLYKDLDQICPNSKFILTVRPTKDWLLSVLNHYASTPNIMNEWIYGKAFPTSNEEIYIDRYEKHNSEVIAYFKNRPNDLLVLHSDEGYSWDKLCDFLGTDIPTEEFPHLNQRSLKVNNKFLISLKNFLLRK